MQTTRRNALLLQGFQFAIGIQLSVEHDEEIYTVDAVIGIILIEGDCLGVIILGKFQLTGIAPAPRGVPQIEVTFDIDANGIVNVSAKDLGTGTEQHITITSSSNMSKEDIEKAVKEAEQYAAEDAKVKEKVEVRNQADQMVYQSEKTLGEVGDKIPADEKAKVQSGIDKLKEVLKGDDTDAIKSATEELTQMFYQMSEKLYQQANPQGGAQAGPDMGGQNGGAQTGPNGQQYYDADYKVVDDDDNNKK